jgi:catechol 2,3-dioxygenase-like lactoylglutathione lyase family enzyme
VDQRLETVVVPVDDVDRIRYFYRARGFRLDLDQADCTGRRIVRLTPPGSLCSIVLDARVGTGSTTGILTVTDLEAAVTELRALGVRPSPICDYGNGYAQTSFCDPEGNLWLLLGDGS